MAELNAAFRRPPRVELAVRIGMCRTGPRRCRRDKTANRGLTWRKQPGGTMIERGWLMQRGIEPRIPLLGAPPPSCFRSPLSSVTAVFLLGWQNEKDRPLPASGERERPAKREGEGRRRCRSDRPVPQLGTNPPSTLYACPVMLRAPGRRGIPPLPLCPLVDWRGQSECAHRLRPGILRP